MLSFFDLELGKVEVKRKQALAVVENHKVPFKVQGARQQHGSGIHCGNRRALRCAEVEPLMRALHFAVENAAGAEDAGDGSVHWRPEVPLHSRSGSTCLKISCFRTLSWSICCNCSGLGSVNLGATVTATLEYFAARTRIFCRNERSVAAAVVAVIVSV